MSSDVDPADLTTKARIREAAMREFGELGFERATVRGVAAAAGVSSGLVRHHFGSKQGLRDACDEQLSRIVRRLAEQAGDPDRAGTIHPAAGMGPYQRYLSRALTEGSAQAVFDGMVELSEPWIRQADRKLGPPPETDVRRRAVLRTAMALAVPLLADHISRGFGVDVLSPEGELPLLRALLDIYSQPALTREEAAELRAGLEAANRPAIPRSRRQTAVDQGAEQ